MSHNTKYYRKKLKKRSQVKKIDVLFRQQAFRQQALASENSANITPKQTEKVEASAEIAESSASTKVVRRHPLVYLLSVMTLIQIMTAAMSINRLMGPRAHKIHILIFLKQNICCEYSKEPS